MHTVLTMLAREDRLADLAISVLNLPVAVRSDTPWMVHLRILHVATCDGLDGTQSVCPCDRWQTFAIDDLIGVSLVLNTRQFWEGTIITVILDVLSPIQVLNVSRVLQVGTRNRVSLIIVVVVALILSEKERKIFS